MAKRRKSSSQRKRRTLWTRSLLPAHCLISAALLAGQGLSADEEEDAAFFEGGEEAYENWVELSVGGLLTRGSEAQAEQSRRREAGPFGGLQDFHYQYATEDWTVFSADGRALFDQNDYKVSLGVEKEDVYYIKLNYRNYRNWFNGNGGYFPPTDVFYPLGDEALAIDRGEISFEAGLSLENLPAFTFKYAHLYRNGEKASTSWGLAHPEFPANLAGVTRALAPAFHDIDEERDIFELNGTHQIKETKVGLGLRYEFGDLDNARKIYFNPGEPGQRKLTHREGTSYDMFNVHAFSETWIRENLLFSSGFLFANLENEFSGSRIYGSDFDVNYAPNALNGQGFLNLDGGSQMHEYVLNLNLMSRPTETLTIIPSVRVQKEDWNADSTTFSTSGLGGPIGPTRSDSDGDLVDVRERLDIRYTGLTNWVLYARAELTQGEGNLDEAGGIYLGAPINRETEDERNFQKYSAGFRWYPVRGISLDLGGYYKKNKYEYDHSFDNTPNGAGANRYPAFLTMQDFETYDGNARLTLRLRPNLTLVSRYEYQISTINTQPAAASGLSEVESSEMTSHIIAQNVTWAPWSRLYLQVGFNYVLSETETPASKYTESILDAENNYWTLHFNSGLVVDDKTDLNVGYTYYRADNYEDNSTVGVPLGAGAEEHGITATLIRRITEKLRLTLRYGYFHYEDELSGGNNDYEAHALLSSLQYRF